MSDFAIHTEKLSKAYKIHHSAEKARYKTIQESILSLPKRVFASKDTSELFWALKDISFEIMQGERVGIIGRNGAGKSTLLKLLSKITEPTSGEAIILGRVASLLEVGTGFHPELSGRENIFMNGAILGMTRSEIKAKFDEIVAFAEVEKFIDTPVKRYSSGMYVRLAFAVAAHLEPEILLVDEVLAVGDSEFQKKCLGKMGEVTQSGRTILFVSHNMAAIQQLCNRGIVLHEGKVSFIGDTQAAVSYYAQNVKTYESADLAGRKDRKGAQWLRFYRIAFLDSADNEISQVLSGQDLNLRFYYKSDRIINSATVNIAFNVRGPFGNYLTNLNNQDVAQTQMQICKEGYFECLWPHFNLRSGSYSCALFCSVNGEIVDWLQSAFSLLVEDGDYFKTGKLTGRDQGDFLVDYKWTSHDA
jgi:lipopolysaccharide transport system ATP-binding protein